MRAAAAEAERREDGLVAAKDMAVTRRFLLRGSFETFFPQCVYATSLRCGLM